MKAYILHGVNDIRFEETNKPVPNAGEVLVKVMAAGICGSDIPRIYKNGAHKHPIIIGHEFAGQVVEAADEEGKDWLGKKVGIFPLIPCRECAPCKNKQYEMCRHYNYLGSRCDGGYAEYVSVPAWNLIELDEKVDYSIAAMMEPMAVATHAVRGLMEDKTDKDVSILVWGVGTIGIMVVMMLRQMGYKHIYAIANKESQVKAIVDNLSIDKGNICNASAEDPIEWISSKGIIPDYTFECVGKADTMNACIDVTAPAGHIMLVGNPYGDMDIPRDTYWKILRNQLTIKGTWNSSFRKEKDDDWQYLARLLNSGELKPEFLISHRYSLENLMSGFELMRDKKEPYIKCMWVNE